MARFQIAATHKSSGKTTITTGLCRAFSRRGQVVQPFKKGPDFIDPMWLGKAAKRACYNLDFHTQSAAEITQLLAMKSAGSSLQIIESNKGLYDGRTLDGSDSNAALAVLTHSPVILVIDCQGITRGVAPLLMGYQAFGQQTVGAGLRLAGVILNRIAGPRHEQKLLQAVQHYSDLPILGILPRCASLQMTERHLGLVPSNEDERAEPLIEAMADAVEQHIDLSAIQVLAASDAQGPVSTTAILPPRNRHQRPKSLGIARDSAFGFYYADDLEQLQAAGVELVEFNTLEDRRLPDVDGLMIGGGFPETHLEALQENTPLRQDIARFIEADRPVYAECGGLMYLGRSIRWGEKTAQMVSALPLSTQMHAKPVGKGYVDLEATGTLCWGPGQGQQVPAHEFHYSSVEAMDTQAAFGYRVRRGFGIDGRHDAIQYRKCIAGYAHHRHTSRHPWTRYFVDFL